MGLSCKTFDGADPVGRQNIYICCCGEDVRHSKQIMSDLFGCRNSRSCAVWYNRTPDSEISLSDLLHMQLVVLAVTNNLLNKYSDAFRSQLRFIRENNIPLLPIIIGGCDIGEYRFKFRDSDDAACLFADSEMYQYELDKRLKLLLGGVSLIKSVRDGHFIGSLYYTFAARDSAPAHKLATRLHDQSGCRDIALLTDNPLQRDRIFGSDSAKLIDKSRAMLISVTPGILSDERDFIRDATNYAERRNIPILPVEMAEIRERRLYRRFKKLPSCYGRDELPKVRKAVIDSIGRHAYEDSPAQKYYIGAAYLYGIDLEIDRDRAQQLIMASASEGFLPAQEQMVRMYSYGIGVDTDIATAAAWQKKAARQLVSIYGRDTSEVNAVKMLDGVNTLCEYYIRIAREHKVTGLLDKAKRQLIEMDDFCRRHPHTSRSTGLMHEQSRCRDNLGRIYELLDDNDAALGMLCSAEESYENEMKLNISRASLRSVASVRERLGRISLAQGDDSRAESYYRGALGLREQAAASDGVTERRELAQCYHNLSEVFELRRDSARQEECRLRELDIQDRLARTTDSIQSRRDLVDNLKALCRMHLYRKNYSEAKKYGIRAVDALSRLAGEISSASITRELIESYETLGAIYEKMQLVLSAASNYRKALEVRRNMAKDDPNDYELQDAFAAACYNLASMDPSQDDYRMLMRTAAKIWEKLYYRTEISDFHDHALSARHMLGHSDEGYAAKHIDVVKVYGRK